jgi:hypothetical protein
MICLSPSDIRSDLKEFAAAHSIKLFEAEIGFNQEPFVVMSEKDVHNIVKLMEGILFYNRLMSLKMLYWSPYSETQLTTTCRL